MRLDLLVQQRLGEGDPAVNDGIGGTDELVIGRQDVNGSTRGGPEQEEEEDSKGPTEEAR